MKKLIGIGLVLSFVLACTSCVLYLSFHRGLYFSLAVTFFTTFYHFAMRIIVAIFVTYFRSGKTTEDGRPIQIGKHEAAFYKQPVHDFMPQHGECPDRTQLYGCVQFCAALVF